MSSDNLVIPPARRAPGWARWPFNPDEKKKAIFEKAAKEAHGSSH
jgi:hypothetical protein